MFCNNCVVEVNESLSARANLNGKRRNGGRGLRRAVRQRFHGQGKLSQKKSSGEFIVHEERFNRGCGDGGSVRQCIYGISALSLFVNVCVMSWS